MAGEFMRIEMLAALHGDCLLVEYGDIRRTRRILIDSGPVGAYAALRGRLERLPKGDRRFELMVLSHVDTDHIEGLIKLFANPRPWPFVVRDVWFNGWRHLEQAHGLLGGRQGEFFGNPGGNADVFRKGYVVRAWTDGLVLDMPVCRGDSGAGILDDQGRVVGVVSAMTSEAGCHFGISL